MNLADRPVGDFYCHNRNIYGLSRLGGQRLESAGKGNFVRLTIPYEMPCGRHLEIQLHTESRPTRPILVTQLYVELWREDCLELAIQGVICDLPEGFNSIKGVRRNSIGPQAHDLLAWTVDILGMNSARWSSGCLMYWHLVDINDFHPMSNADLALSLQAMFAALEDCLPPCSWLIVNTDHPSVEVSPSPIPDAGMSDHSRVDSLCRHQLNRISSLLHQGTSAGSALQGRPYALVSAVGGTVLGVHRLRSMAA